MQFKNVDKYMQFWKKKHLYTQTHRGTSKIVNPSMTCIEDRQKK